MEDIRAEKLLLIRFIKFLNDFQTTEVTERRIGDYDYQKNTTIAFNDTEIKISTPAGLEHLYNVLWLFQDGSSKLDFEIDRK